MTPAKTCHSGQCSWWNERRLGRHFSDRKGKIPFRDPIQFQSDFNKNEAPTLVTEEDSAVGGLPRATILT